MLFNLQCENISAVFVLVYLNSYITYLYQYCYFDTNYYFVCIFAGSVFIFTFITDIFVMIQQGVIE